MFGSLVFFWVSTSWKKGTYLKCLPVSRLPSIVACVPCKCPEASEAELDRVSSSIQDFGGWFGAFLKMEHRIQLCKIKQIGMIGHICTCCDLLGEALHGYRKWCSALSVHWNCCFFRCLLCLWGINDWFCRSQRFSFNHGNIIYFRRMVARNDPQTTPPTAFHQELAQNLPPKLKNHARSWETFHGEGGAYDTFPDRGWALTRKECMVWVLKAFIWQSADDVLVDKWV